VAAPERLPTYHECYALVERFVKES
jgi:hypothetical protein